MNTKVYSRVIIVALSYAIITLLLIKVTDKLILTPDFYERSNKYFGDNPLQGEYIYQHIHYWVYPLSVLYILLKFLLISAIIYSGFYFSGKKVCFPSVLLAVIMADYLFFIPAVTKIIYFLNNYPDGDLNDWIHYYPASLLSVINYEGEIWLYPLQTLNIYEIVYWFLLAFFLARSLKLSFDPCLRIVVVYYIPALIIWSIVVICYAILINPS